ncbi:MAG: GntR family transcriptional regulator, partial [Actinomycetota bacterium]
MELEPVRKTSASGAVFDQLIAELVAGRLEPGESLPAERALTERLGVNRQAVREALQRLAQAGLIKINQGEPTRALDYRRSAGLDLLPRLLFDAGGTVDVEVARSIIEMRALIGPEVARLAATRSRAEMLPALEAVVAEMGATEDLGLLARLDLDLWDLLID